MAWRAVSACLCALLACVGARAAEGSASALRVQLEQLPGGGNTLVSRQIGLHGSAPARCVPDVSRVVVDGIDLSIELKTPQTGCDANRQQPFSLRVDPATSAGVPILPGQVYRVRVYANNGGTSQLLAFHLLDTNTPTSAPTPENGFWWSEASTENGAASPGNGASIELQDGQLAIGLFGFNDTGAATWYFGTARPSGRVATASLVQLANGDPPFAPSGSQPVAQAGPRIEIEFLSPSRAHAWLVRNESGRDVEVRALTLARSRFAAGAIGNAWNGQWVLVPDEGGAPRVFDFSAPVSQDAETFHLADAGSDAGLDCRLANGAQRPELCTLSVAATVLADFDQIGIDHLAGRSSTGARVKLVRVPR